MDPDILAEVMKAIEAFTAMQGYANRYKNSHSVYDPLRQREMGAAGRAEVEASEKAAQAAQAWHVRDYSDRYAKAASQRESENSAVMHGMMERGEPIDWAKVIRPLSQREWDDTLDDNIIQDPAAEAAHQKWLANQTIDVPGSEFHGRTAEYADRVLAERAAHSPQALQAEDMRRIANPVPATYEGWVDEMDYRKKRGLPKIGQLTWMKAQAERIEAMKPRTGESSGMGGGPTSRPVDWNKQ